MGDKAKLSQIKFPMLICNLIIPHNLKVRIQKLSITEKPSFFGESQNPPSLSPFCLFLGGWGVGRSEGRNEN